MPKILLLEDDLSLAKSVADWLRAKHFTLEHVSTAQKARDYLAASKYDVLVLDWHLPDGTGLDVLVEFRDRGGTTPVIMLTAMSSIEHKEAGFTAGSDDYLTKPFRIKELELRIRAILRRPDSTVDRSLSCEDLTLTPDTFTCTLAERPIQLLPGEFALLEFLMRHKGQVFSAESLLERVWKANSEAGTGTVLNTIMRLRKKLSNTAACSFISTIHGVGYKFDSPQMQSPATNHEKCDRPLKRP